MTNSVRPWGDRSLWVVMQWTVSGEMLMPSRTASKLGLVWNDSAAWMSVQAAIGNNTINKFIQRPEGDWISALRSECAFSYQ